jgi:C1A family cysteine protease
MFTLPIPRNPRYGWIPDLPDQRDLPYATLAVALPQLPKVIDLRSHCSSVENQGDLGSCTACALVGNLEYIKKITLKRTINFSRLFLYYNERVIRHTQKSDSGASIRDGIKSLVKTGDCLERLWPYDANKFAIKPPKTCYREAEDLQITKYYRIHTTSEMKQTLSLGFPFVFGFAVYESFESPIVAKTGIVPMPRPDERVVGGHAVMAVGYDDTKKCFVVRNSWGTSWGDNGYFFMPYGYVSNSSLSSDFWTIRAME